MNTGNAEPGKGNKREAGDKHAPWLTRHRAAPYGLIGVVSLLAHWLLLTNDGTFWDSWYVLSWLRERNFAPMHEFFGAVGIPLYGWLYRPFAYAPAIVTAFMAATFACLYATGVLTYKAALALTRLTKGEALAIATLATAMPVFSAAQDFIMFFFVFTHAVFMAACLIVATAMRERGPRHWILRLGAIACFLVSFTNASLLVFYGGAWVLFFLQDRAQRGGSLFRGVTSFVRRYPDLLCLPPASWIARSILTPQHGWFRYYNSPSVNLPHIPANIGSFFENVPWWHFLNVLEWLTDHLLVVGLLVMAAIMWWKFAPSEWRIRPGSVATVHLVWFGSLLLLFALLPFAAAGKKFAKLPFVPVVGSAFDKMPIGEDSRHCILVGLPSALLGFALLRTVFRLIGAPSSRWMPITVALMVVVLGAQIPRVYLVERAQWILSKSLLHNATKDKTVEASSVVILQNSSLARATPYSIYGFGSAFGERTRYVTAQVPQNQRFFTPAEIQLNLLMIALLPNDFRNIDPAGQQILLVAKMKREEMTDWEIARRYLALKYFASREEFDSFLASLTSLETRVLKLSSPPTQGSNAVSSFQTRPGDFTNSLGIQMVMLPEGWWASRFETTQAQYQALMSANPSLFKDPTRPVERVSWNDADEFCRRLTRNETLAGRLPPGMVYRLPTVAEFERYSRDSALADSVLSYTELRWHTAPVGSMRPNSLGIFDAIGNVWEWCLDSSPKDFRCKVSMGGSWVDAPVTLQPYSGPLEPPDTHAGAAAERLFGPSRRDYPDQGFWDRGFRCVVAPPPVGER